MEHRPTRAQLGRSSAWSLVNTFAAQGLNLAVFLVTARFVAPEAFGVLAAAILVNELFRTIVVEPILTAVNTRARPSDADYTTCFWLIVACSMIGAELIFLGAPLFAWVMGEPSLVDAVKLTALLVLTAGFSRTHEARLVRTYQFRTLAIRSTASILIGGAVGIVMAVMGFGLWALVAQQLVTSTTSLLFLWTVSRWRPRGAVSKAISRRIWRYGRHVSLTGATNYVNQQADTFFAIAYLGAGAAGFYSAGKRITGALNTAVGTSLNKVALPMFAGSKDDPRRLRRGYLAAVGLTCLVTAPVFAMLAALAPEVTQLLLGERWAPAAPLIAILCIPAFLGTIGQYNHSIILALDKPHWQTWLTAIYAVTNVGLFVGFASRGVIALALAFSLRSLFLYPLSFGAALFLLRINWSTYFRTIAPACIGCLFLGAVMILMSALLPVHNVLLRIVMMMLAGAGIYGVAIRMVAPRKLEELFMLFKSLRRGT